MEKTSEQEMEEIREKVFGIISEQLDVEVEKITPEREFTPEDLGADSLDRIELVMAFEKAFEIEIPDEKAERIKTVGQAIGILREELEEKQRSLKK